MGRESDAGGEIVTEINDTHAPSLQSWIESANQAGTDFPIQNLPFGVFRRKGTAEAFRGGVAIGDQILDLAAVNGARVFSSEVADALAACCQPALNAYMSMERSVHSAVRRGLSSALRQGAPEQARLARCLVPQDESEYAVPATIGDYTDFYTSIYHATSIGRLFRPDNPLMPNYKWVPIGYHGRSSTIGVSVQIFPRPYGQIVSSGSMEPRLAKTEKLDYELELGIFIGKNTVMG